jgi:hypothetical protein
MTSSAVIRKTSFAGRRNSFANAAAIRPVGNEPQEIAESLLALAGVGVLGYVRLLVEKFRSEGYAEAAARWDAIATVMGSIITAEPVGEREHLLSSPTRA